MLSTGHAQNFIPNTSLGEPTLGNNIESDLLSIANSVPPLIGQTFSVTLVEDVAVLEFDFIAPSAIMDIHFTYGSDEYLTYVNSQYNDVFAILLSGPNVSGPYASPGYPNGAQNLAVVPGTDPALPITISSVNNVLNNNLYIDNPANAVNTGISLTGYTTEFTTSMNLIPGQVYHLKFGIADGSDSALKSLIVMNASFLNGNSLPSCASIEEDSIQICNGGGAILHVSSASSFSTQTDGGLYIPDNQGCLYSTLDVTGFSDGALLTSIDQIQDISINMEHSFVGDIVLSLICPDGSVMNIFPEAGGSGSFLGEPIDDESGIPGLGYNYTFSPFSSGGTWMELLSVGIPTIPAGDYAPEDSFNNLLGCPLNGTWTLEICDIVGADDGYLFQFGLDFNNGTPNNNFVWSNGELTPTLFVNPSETTTYYLYSDANGQSCVDSVVVSVSVPVSITTDGSPMLCGNGIPVTLQATGASSYLWNIGSTSSSIAVFNPGTYSVTGSTGGCESTASIDVSVNTEPLIVEVESQVLCSGDTITLTALGMNEYFWNNGGSGPVLDVTQGGDYFVGGIADNGCEFSSDIITITEIPFDNTITASSYGLCDGQSATLSANNENDVVWSTGETTSAIVVNEPGTFYAYVSNGACESITNEITLTTGVTPVVNAFAINNTPCNNEGAILLVGSPAGGIWSGVGTDQNFFYPQTTGVGEFIATYTYTNTKGCAGNFDVLMNVLDCTLIENIETQRSYSIYPNPSNDLIHILAPNQGRDYSLFLSDMQGRIVLEQLCNSSMSSIDVGNFSIGCYNLKIIDSEGIRNHQIIIGE
jgi:subtilisin-like proprotein convertase family protein